MGERNNQVALREHAKLTRSLAEKAKKEGNAALAHELERIARDSEDRSQNPGHTVISAVNGASFFI